MASTKIQRYIAAPRAVVYRAFLEAKAVERWMVPNDMTSEVHTFEPREGGAFRISLTHDGDEGTGKTSANTDTQRGHFVTLVADEKIVQTVEFETDKPSLRGEMTITITLADSPSGGTYLTAVHDHLPPGLSAAENEKGWRHALDKLATLVERPPVA